SRIAELSFSKDGRLLASCSSDHTVNAWWLSDLQETIDRLGGLPEGFRIEQTTARRYQVFTPGQTGLQTGDELLGVWPAEQSRPALATTAGEFVDQISKIRPGRLAKIGVRLKDGRESAIQIVVGQGVDARNPLFSLFVNHEEPEDWSWL